MNLIKMASGVLLARTAYHVSSWPSSIGNGTLRIGSLAPAAFRRARYSSLGAPAGSSATGKWMTVPPATSMCIFSICFSLVCGIYQQFSKLADFTHQGVVKNFSVSLFWAHQHEYTLVNSKEFFEILSSAVPANRLWTWWKWRAVCCSPLCMDTICFPFLCPSRRFVQAPIVPVSASRTRILKGAPSRSSVASKNLRFVRYTCALRM